MSDVHAPRPASSVETPPSTLCTDCPKETCLEFTVVDYWGEPVTSPSRFELDGKPVRPDTPIRPLKPGKHILRAVDGEELRQEILNFPYEPVWHMPTPASRLARQQGQTHTRGFRDRLWTGLPLVTRAHRPAEACHKYLVEVNYGIDYCILMVFLDNHSGGLHGTGHAGVMIINGETRQGLYSDFGPYKKKPGKKLLDNNAILELGEVRIDPLKENLLLTKNGKLDEKNLAELFHEINDSHGSTMISEKSCRFQKLLNGPAHGNIPKDVHPTYKIFHDINTLCAPIKPDSIVIPSGFLINGLIAWAAYILPGGAYCRMEKYVQEKRSEMIELQDKSENGYKIASFNCMTYSLAVLDQGLGLTRPPGIQGNIDHPNAHIQAHMNTAQECGIFDDRLFSGEPEAMSGKVRPKVPGIRHHQVLNFAYSWEKLHAKP